MRASEVVKVYAQIKLLWPPRLVDPLTDEAAVMVAAALPSEATLAHALAVVNDFFRRGSPFPPSWPEIAERWTARAHGVSEDPGLIAGRWLAEVGVEMGKRGGALYRPMPEFSDPIIAEAIVVAAGSWLEWGMTPTGGVGEGGAFVRNEVPARDDRFRRACVALIKHRRETGERLPSLAATRRAALDRPTFALPAAGSGDEAVPTMGEDEAFVAAELEARDRERDERERRKAEARERLAEMDREGDS